MMPTAGPADPAVHRRASQAKGRCTVTESQKRALRLSEIRQRLNELLRMDEPTDEQRTELATLSDECGTVEVEYRAALRAEGEAEQRTETNAPDPETRERIKLRTEARAGGYLLPLLLGNHLSGAAAEYQASREIPDDAIALDYFEGGRPAPDPEIEQRAATPAPTTGAGVNLEPIQPFIFSEGLAALLGIEIKSVESGTFSTATITTALPAEAKAKAADAPDTAAALTAQTSGVKRIASSVQFTAEDVASVGVGNFEAALLENMRMSMQDAHDDAVLIGDGNAPNIKGLLTALGSAATRSTRETFASYAKEPAAAVDGVWARTMADVLLLVGTDTYTDAAGIFQSNTAVSAASFLMGAAGGFRSSDRVPDKASDVQQALAYRRGRPGIRPAVQATWNRLSIDDRFSLGKSAQRVVSMHLLCGDVIVRHSGAYKRTAFKLA